MGERRQANLLFLLSTASLACAAGDIGVDPGPLSAASFGSATATGGDDSQDTGSESGGSGAVDGVDDAPDDDDGVDDAPNDTGDDAPDEGPPGDGPLDDGPGSTDDGPLDDSMDEAPGDGPLETDGGTYYGACADYGATIALCFPGDARYYEYLCYTIIDDYYAAYGAACADAVEDLFACIATLDCASISAGVGCDAESAAFNASC